MMKNGSREKAKAMDRKLYETHFEQLTDLAPKSFSGYQRMKNAKTKNYLKLAEAAKEKNIFIEKTLN